MIPIYHILKAIPTLLEMEVYDDNNWSSLQAINAHAYLG